jgi:hypothetical protein
MKRLISLGALASLFVLHAGVAAAPADTFTDVVKIPLFLIDEEGNETDELFLECAGEVVKFSGELVFLVHETTRPDGSVVLRFHLSPRGAKAVGQTTGDVYRAVGVTQGVTIVDEDGLPFQDTFINNFNIVGPGPDNVTALIHQNIHVLIDAEGNLQVDVDNTFERCL